MSVIRCLRWLEGGSRYAMGGYTFMRDGGKVIVVGLFLVGFSLVALFWWMPIWEMGSFGSIEELLGYFVLVMLLLFGVFMAANDSDRMRGFGSLLALVAGCLVSAGVEAGRVVFGLGLVLLLLSWAAVRRA